MERQKIVVYQCLLTIRVDLSEPPNGTTSGCPPPSQHHNYRRYLHTQQRNCSERCESGRFWKGVAQITRIRDRTFIASPCSIKTFRLGAFCVRDRCAGQAVRRFSLSRLYPHRIKRPKRPPHRKKCSSRRSAQRIVASAVIS